MKQISSFHFILFLLLSTFSQLSSAKSISDQDVKQYMALSGVDSALNGIPAQMGAMGQQMQMTAEDPAEAQKVMQLLESSWQQQEVEQIVANHIKTKFTATEMQSLLTWLNSDLARRIKSSEEKASAANFNQEFMQYMAQLQSTPPTAERVKVIRTFVETTDMIDHTVDIVMSVAKGTIKGLKAANPHDEVSEEAVMAQIGQMEAMMRPALEQQMIMVSYYIYDSLTDQEIEQYSQFYQQPLGKKELTVMYDGIGQALTHWSTQAFSKIANEFSE